MSIASENRRNDYTGNGSTNIYPYGFKIFAQSELEVVVRDTTTNVETVLVLTTDYTVSGVGASGGGNITLVNNGQAWLTSGNLSTGKHLTILGARPATQTTDVRNQGTYYPETIEDSFDSVVMVLQQLKEKLSRAVVIPESTLPSGFNPQLPSQNGIGSPTPGANLIVNPTANGWAFGSPQLGWTTVDLSYAAFSAAATSKQIGAFTLPKNCILIGAALKHSVAFAGAGISLVTMDLGTVATPDQLLSAFDVLQAVSDSAFINAMLHNIQSFANDTVIQIQAKSGGANLSALTQGVVRVYYWYMNLGS